MNEAKKPLFSRLMDWSDKFVNAVCVALLGVQVLATIVMVFGRYFFQYVPRGTEELALFCMVWFSLISLSMSVRDDSHIKMEIVDMIFKKHPQTIRWFKLFAGLVTLAFSIFMIYYGANLVELTSVSKMSGMRVTQSWIYMPIPVGGVFMALACVAIIFESFRRKPDDQ